MNWIDFMFSKVFLSVLSATGATVPPGPASDPFANLLASMLGTASPPSGSAAGPNTATLEPAFLAAARQTGLSPALIKAVAHVESGNDPQAVSSAGAIGVMQLMPDTAHALGVDPHQAGSNILGGAEYLAGLLQQFHGSLPLALAAYNAGPGAVQAHGGIPPYAETQAYVAKVMATYQRYQA